jgi:hypothetical protein
VQSTSKVGGTSSPSIARTPMLPTVWEPPSHASKPAAASRPFAATSTLSRSRPTSDVSSHGVNVFVYGLPVPASWTLMTDGEDEYSTEIIREPSSAGLI